MDQFLNVIKGSFPKIQEEVLDRIKNAFQRVEKKKGQVLLEQGKICESLYFLSDGICRCYSINDGNDITTWFGFQNEFLTSFTSFFPKEPSYESIQMLTDGVLYEIRYDELLKLRQTSIEVERIVNRFSLQYTIQLEKRLFQIQTQSASEKYRSILQKEPRLFQYVSTKHIASYLGISRETLSRIRSSIS